jgi:hypothetical protein
VSEGQSARSRFPMRRRIITIVTIVVAVLLLGSCVRAVWGPATFEVSGSWANESQTLDLRSDGTFSSTGIEFPVNEYSEFLDLPVADAVVGEWIIDHSGGPDLTDTVVRLSPIHPEDDVDEDYYLNGLWPVDLDIEGVVLVTELVPFDSEGTRLSALARSADQ